MRFHRSGSCWECGKTISMNGFNRQDSCPGCTKATRVCRNCRFYDPLCYNECLETQAERVVDKEKTTFCDFFKANSTLQKNKVENNIKSARQAAEDLFR